MKEKGFTQLPNYLWDMNLTIYERVVLVHIIRQTIGWGKQSDGISLSQFENTLSISKYSVIKALKSLADKKIITKREQKKSNGSQSFNRYSIHNRVVREANRGSASDKQGVVREANRQKITNTKDTKQKENIKESVNIPESLNLQAWEEFKKHRNDFKMKFSDLAKQKIINKLSTKPKDEQQRMVDNSIENGWKGVFDLKSNQTAKQYTYNEARIP